jgi:hypothetical protein
MRRLSLLRDRGGAAAVEMALVTPLLLVILMGSVEMGNFFWTEHRLVKAVRDGARYAARQPFSNYSACTGSPPQAIIDDTKTLVRKGSLDSSAADQLPNWATATFSVSIDCTASLTDSSGNFVPKGIYANLAGGAPAVTVTASLPYRAFFGKMLGFNLNNASLNARQQAAVVGV